MAAFMDLQAAKQSSLSLPGLDEAYERLAAKLDKTMDRVMEGWKENRARRSQLWATLRELLAETDSKKVLTLVNGLISEEISTATDGQGMSFACV